MSSPTVARGTPDLRATSAVDSEPFERGSAVAEANRYPGSPPFGDTDVDRLLFRGRAAETDEVLHSILSYDLFLVYAVSGMGKTSLLTAGVLEPLRQRGYFPVMLRVNSPDTPMLTLIEAQIRQAGAAAGVEVEHAPTVGADALPADTLWDLLAELEIWRGNDLLEPVLIFDQFEELFTLPWSPDDRAAFIEQFGEVVRHHRVPGRDADPARQALAAPNVKMVLCMREDFIGQLEELAVSVPQIMNRRFRLGALDPVQAEAAIREPAELDDPRLRTRRFSYSAGAASTILTFLRTKDDRGNTVLTDSIDPSQLQIICQHVERSILPRKTVETGGRVEITESDLGGPDGLRRIVVDFYRQVLDAFPQRERRAVRHLCETGLISQSGRRLSLEEGEIGAHFDVSLDTLRKLVDLRLLRSEPRVGSVYYELAHDTLTRPIVAYRDHKRKERRRRLLIAALILAAVVAATIAGLLLASRGNVDEQPAARPVLPIEVGQSISDELTSADDAAAYELGAVDQPVVVQLSPLGFNAALEIADAQDSATTTARVEDAGKVGAPEFAVINSGGPYRLTVRGLAPGQFELSVLQARSNPLAVPGRTRVELTASGAPTLFELTGTDDQAFVVSIVTTSEDGQQTRVPDGAVLQVTGPTGATLQAVPDDAGTLSIVAGGVAGPYAVALRDASGNTSVTYTVSVSPMDVTPAPIGEATDVVVTESNRHAVWEVVASDPQALLLQLTDDYGEAQALIQTPKGAVLPLGSEGSAVVEDGPGNYLVFLSSPWAGMASLSAVNVNVVDVDIGATVPATLGAGNEAAVFRVEAPGDIPLLAQVVSDENLDSVLSLVSGASTVVPASDNAAEGAAEQLVVPRDAPGSLLFAVTRFEDTAGTFEFSVGPAPVQPLAFGETASGELDSGQLALYTVTARDDTPFTVTVDADDEFIIFLSVEGPAGDEQVTLTDNAFLSSGEPGTYTVTVRTYDGSTGYRIRADAVESVPLGEAPSSSALLDGSGQTAIFEFEADPTSTTAVSISTDEGLAVDATVADTGGNVIAVAPGPIQGADSLTLTGVGGRLRVVVTSSSGAGNVRVAARAVTPTSIAPGSALDVDVSAAGDVAVVEVEPGPGLVALDVIPSPGVAVNASTVDSVGNPLIAGDGVSAVPVTVVVDSRVGLVHLVVTVADGAGTIEIRSRTLDATPLTLDNAARGAIRAPGDVVAYEVELADLEDLSVQVTPSAQLDARIVAFDASGLPYDYGAAGAGQQQEPFVGSGPGLYRIVISGAQGSSGEFTLQAVGGDTPELLLPPPPRPPVRVV